MPLLLLSDDDLARAARAARITAGMHERRAEDGDGSVSPDYFVDQARRFRALAEYFERARQSGTGT